MEKAVIESVALEIPLKTDKTIYDSENSLVKISGSLFSVGENSL